MPRPASSRPGPLSKRVRGGFVLEAVGIWVVLYPIFTWARLLVTVSAAPAFRNAEQIVGWEQRLGIYRELAIQRWSLASPWFIGFWNVWYGSIHFFAPIVTFVVLYRFDPKRYVRWRNAYFWMLVPVVIGFLFYPLTPPRLLPTSFGFIDTRLLYFGVGKPAAEELRFAFSAMPSMHIAYATWVVFAVWPLVRPRWAKMLVASYPFLVTFGIVVTGNHYFLDAVGGLVAFTIGYTLARWRDWWPWRPARQSRAHPGDRTELPIGSRAARR
jgi:hypothetical protein